MDPGTSESTISLLGISGAMFWCLLAALIFYVIGFSTQFWETIDHKNIKFSLGLWKTCAKHLCTDSAYNDLEWFKATRAMMIIGLLLLIAGCIVVCIIMFVKTWSFNMKTAIIAFTVMVFAAAGFMLIGFLVYGTNHSFGTLNWSFALCVISAILCVVVGILFICQLKRSNDF